MATLVPKTIRRTTAYKMGGVVQAICFNTYLASGAPALTVTRDAAGKITELELDASAAPALLEFEENGGLFSDDVKIGDNRYPEPTVGYKFSGHDDEKNATLEALDLTYSTHLVRLRSGKIKLVGEKNGLISTQSKSGAGTKREDFEGYDLVLAGGETKRCPDVPEAEWLALVAKVV